MDSLFVFLRFQSNTPFAFNVLQVPGWYCYEQVPFLIQSCFLPPDFFSLAATCTPNCNVASRCILCLRCDLSVQKSPNVVSWIHGLPRYKHTVFGILLESGKTSLFFSCKALPRPSELPTFFLVLLMVSLYSASSGSMTKNTSQSSSIIEFWLLVCPFLFFSLLSSVSNFGPDFRPQILRFRGCLANLSVSSRPQISWEVSLNGVNFVNPFQESDKLRFASTFQQSSIGFFLQHIQISH